MSASSFSSGYDDDDMNSHNMNHADASVNAQQDAMAIHGTIVVLEVVLSMYIWYVCSGECIMAVGSIKLFVGVLLLSIMNVYGDEINLHVGTWFPVASLATGILWIGIGIQKHRHQEQQQQQMDETIWTSSSPQKKKKKKYELVPKEDGCDYETDFENMDQTENTLSDHGSDHGSLEEGSDEDDDNKDNNHIVVVTQV